MIERIHAYNENYGINMHQFHCQIKFHSQRRLGFNTSPKYKHFVDKSILYQQM